MRQLKNSKPFIIKKFLKIPIRDQPIVNRYMSCPAHNYPGSFSEVQDNSSIASISFIHFALLLPIKIRPQGCERQGHEQGQNFRFAMERDEDKQQEEIDY